MADARPDFDDNAEIQVDGVVNVTTSATPLRVGGSLNNLTEYIIIQNIGNSIVWLGSSSVTDGNGIRLTKNQQAILSCKTGNPWYGIVGSGNNDLYIAEMGC